jgi:basic membrane protein A
MVVAHSSAYEAAALEVAPSFPDTWFVVYSDLSTTNGLENIAGWKINWNEMGYMAGTAGCLAAKSKGKRVIGHVNTIPIPAFTHYGGGARDAAEAHGCKYRVKWTDSVEDLTKAQQAAAALVGEGAAVILTSGNAADQGAYRGAADAGALFVALHFDESEVAPEHYLTGVRPDFMGSYEQMGDLLSTEQLEPDIYPLNIENDGVQYVSSFQNVDSSVEKEARQIVDKIRRGSLRVDPESEVKP